MKEEIRVNAEAQTVTLGIDGTYTADQLLALLARIGEARGEIFEEPFQPDPSTLEPTKGWGFFTNTTPDGQCLLALRHPGFGWIANKMPIQSAAQLAGTLNHQAVVILAAVSEALGRMIQSKADAPGGAPIASVSGGSGSLH